MDALVPVQLSLVIRRGLRPQARIFIRRKMSLANKFKVLVLHMHGFEIKSRTVNILIFVYILHQMDCIIFFPLKKDGIYNHEN